MQHKTLAKGVFLPAITTLNVSTGRIVLTSHCLDHEKCKIAWTHLISLEIKAQANADTSEQLLGSPAKLTLNSFEGGNCDQQPENCMFGQENLPAKLCSGDLMLLKIPPNFPNKDLVCKFKCVKIKYETKEECSQYCPGICNSIGKCSGYSKNL